jgi:hypothetical protein
LAVRSAGRGTLYFCMGGSSIGLKHTGCCRLLLPWLGQLPVNYFVITL